VNIPANVLKDLPAGGWMPLTDKLAESLAASGVLVANLPQVTAWFNLPAVLIVGLVTALLVIGIKESATVNNIVVFIKVGVLCIFLVAGLVFLMNSPGRWAENWSTFVPENKGEFGVFGLSGILTGAGVIFFAYIGFDAVSTAAQESKNPQRDLPIGILLSLAICTVFYIAVASVLTGIVHYDTLNVAAPVAVGIDATGYTWLKPIIKIGAIAGLSSVILVMLLAQPRIFYTMSRDGLLPSFVSKLHPKYHTPVVTTVITGTVVAIAGGTAPIGELGHMVSIGTLFAFVLVCAGVLVLRHTHPEIKRPFRAPAAPFVCSMGILICLAQMVALPPITWARLVVWLVIGLVIYFGYGYHHSKMHQQPAPAGGSAT
jgi:APA family basic amino acid/polyamine antiporter